MSDIWTTADGTRIRIPDITTSHLRNAIQCLERRIAELQNAPSAWSLAHTVRGEYAEAAMWAEIEDDRNDVAMRIRNITRAKNKLEAELARRENHDSV